MALKVAMWVHGTIVQAEGQIGSSIRQGLGATFTASNNAFHWFHIPIAAPVILDDVRSKLAKVFVLYSANRYAEIRNLDLYDGAKRLIHLSNLSLSGIHNVSIDASNTFSLSPFHEIEFGLGISVGVAFPYSLDGSILFSAAGADFLGP